MVAAVFYGGNGAQCIHRHSSHRYGNLQGESRKICVENLKRKLGKQTSAAFAFEKIILNPHTWWRIVLVLPQSLIEMRSDVKEAQPVFRIDEIPDMLAGPKWFSTLDFASGYWQAKVRSEDRPKAPFITFMSCRSDCPTLLRLFDDIYDLLKDLNWKVCYLLGCRFTS
ncbi:RNA-directed DNA polymerase -like protein [Trichinella sp. T6]|nr:RNA-directed DNA polymerase -like protein [Trichinella sp. T6]